MTALDEKISRFCVEYGFSQQQTRIFSALMHGALSNEAIARDLGMPEGRVRVHLERIARKTMTISRTELSFLFYEGGLGR